MSSSGAEPFTARVGEAARRAPRPPDVPAPLVDAHFVSLVRGYEELYMRDHPLHGKRNRTRVIWEEIGAIVSQPPEYCKKRWARIKANYLRTLERDKLYPSETHPERPPYVKLLSFLDPTLNELYNKVATTDHDSDKEENYNVSDDNNSLSEDEAPAARQQESAEHDEVVDFFVELGESVKDFPEAVRIHVKREAFRIVTDAEESLYHQKVREDLQNMSQEQE